MKDFNYALIIDDSVQWFAYIVKYSGDKVFEFHSIPVQLENNNPFMSNIYSRTFSIHGKKFNLSGQCCDRFNGIIISPKEFERIAKMINLWDSYVELEKLKQYE